MVSGCRLIERPAGKLACLPTSAAQPGAAKLKNGYCDATKFRCFSGGEPKALHFVRDYCAQSWCEAQAKRKTPGVGNVSEAAVAPSLTLHEWKERSVESASAQTLSCRIVPTFSRSKRSSTWLHSRAGEPMGTVCGIATTPMSAAFFRQSHDPFFA